MSVNQDYTILIRGVVPNTDSAFIINIATVTCLTFDPNPDNNTAIEYTAINASADVQITKTSYPNPVSINEELVYTLVITNNGPSTAENVVVYDENIYYLSNVQYSINNGLTWDRWNGSYSIGTMTNGQINTILIRGFVYDSGAQYIKNKAYISSSTYDPNPNNNTVITYTKIRTCTDVGICQYCRENLLVVSEMAQFALKVFNNGPNNASNIIIKDDVSSFLYNPEYSINCGVTWNTYTGSITISDLYRCNSIDILIRGIAIFTGNNYITNTATVYSDNEDCNTCNNTSQKIIKLISYYC